jgi:hypothetical protein
MVLVSSSVESMLPRSVVTPKVNRRILPKQKPAPCESATGGPALFSPRPPAQVGPVSITTPRSVIKRRLYLTGPKTLSHCHLMSTAL